jgi:hypothetical protein
VCAPAAIQNARTLLCTEIAKGADPGGMAGKTPRSQVVVGCGAADAEAGDKVGASCVHAAQVNK